MTLSKALALPKLPPIKETLLVKQILLMVRATYQRCEQCKVWRGTEELRLLPNRAKSRYGFFCEDCAAALQASNPAIQSAFAYRLDCRLQVRAKKEAP